MRKALATEVGEILSPEGTDPRVSTGSNHHLLSRNISDASSESSEDESKKDEPATESREKKMKKVDTANPFSTFDRQTSNRKRYFVPSGFVKGKWLHIRDMDAEGKYMSENNKPDLWKNVAKSDKLVRKYSGDVLADSKLDDGLYSLVDKKATNEEEDLVRSQRVLGSIGHLPF